VSESAIQLVICLATAHFLGDFILQTDQDVARKSRPLTFARHVFLVGLASYVFAGAWKTWQIPVVIVATHAFLDWAKETLSRWSAKKAPGHTLSLRWRVYPFLADQFLHLVAIVILSWFLTRDSTSPLTIFWVDALGKGVVKALVVLSGAIVCIKAGGILIGMLVAPLLRELQEEREKAKEELKGEERGFEQGGKIIGQLERALIFLLVLLNQPAGVGFLIAAKSIFRFGELKEHRHRMEAEYIIIGTLMSFGYGIFTAWLTTYVLGLI